jgi:hypothetical protein
MSKKDDCNCTFFPWTPDRCVLICGGGLVFKSSSSYLKSALDLDSQIVQKISDNRSDGPWESLEDLGRFLDADELGEVIAKVKAYSEARATAQLIESSTEDSMNESIAERKYEA